MKAASSQQFVRSDQSTLARHLMSFLSRRHYGPSAIRCLKLEVQNLHDRKEMFR